VRVSSRNVSTVEMHYPALDSGQRLPGDPKFSSQYLTVIYFLRSAASLIVAFILLYFTMLYYIYCLQKDKFPVLIYCHVFRAALVIITDFGLDDWIYHLFLYNHS
jgi:hypothetical protein